MADVLKYGDKVHIQNGYDGWKGGYLDTNGGSSQSGSLYGVSTTDTPTRGKGTGTWEIISATGKNTGEQVLSGDVIHLRNLYANDGGYLDTNGGASPDQTAAAKYDVTTHKDKDRASVGTASWRIFAQTSAPADQFVRTNDIVILWNLYSPTGSFLETNGGTTASGGKYDVCTSAYWNRSSNVGDWRLIKAKA
ncbi:hypothetical protein [Streptomyces sp. NPDC058268]|uniref:hypothetical protein n=1 Tax=Streptomyces sp. NPDC058268 TaxID=3346413 RepID=UPI0036EEC0B1